MKSNLRFLFVGSIILSLLNYLFPSEVDVGLNLAIDPITGAALITGGAGLLQGIGNLFGQSSANETNRLIAQENREWQTEENQKNRDFNERMWNLQNVYNTPKKMMERYLEAGLNPYLVGSNSGVGSAGSVPSPSMSSSPSMPNIQPLRFGDALSGIDRGLNMMLQSKQLSINEQMTKAESLQKFVESYAEVYKTGGKKQADNFVKTFLPMLGNFDEDSSPIAQYMKSQRYNIDMDSLNQEFMYSTNYRWTEKEKQQRFENLKAENQQIFGNISLMFAKEMNERGQLQLNIEKMKTFASEIAKNYAEAFQARKVGEYYEVSAENLGIIKKMTSLEFEEALADFNFGAATRVYKNSVPGAMTNKNLFVLGLKSGAVNLGLQSNQRLQYAKQFSEMVGNVFKVNVGLSKNSSRSHSTGNLDVNSNSYVESNNVTQHSAPTPVIGFGQ